MPPGQLCITHAGRRCVARADTAAGEALKTLTIPDRGAVPFRYRDGPQQDRVRSGEAAMEIVAAVRDRVPV